ncbi:MAG: hypothetical protein JL50_18270 [Peptococcaceae bacterium BICA1-7]|nr:MAG: hypothetical protein JL50_18270 [Peptococcaceae bacterium BICA1-7]HBV96354.1 N-acetyltransferase [Desulfotomaculum sp.]
MTTPENSKKDLTLEIRMMQPEDAAGVVELYRAVYGDHYPVKTVYDTNAIMDLQDKGDMIRIIARADGKVVGQAAFYRSACPNPSLYELGQGIVLPAYRNMKILERCMAYGHDEVCPRLKINQLWGEAVCNHVFVQRTCQLLNYVETGIELDLMPASSYEKEKSSSGRVSTLVAFKRTTPNDRPVYLPLVYREVLSYIYPAFNEDQSFLPAESGLPDTSTEGKTEIYQGAGVARFTIMQAGGDLEDFLKKQEAQALAKGCRILQVYLDLSSPFIDGAVDTARKLQYFFGAALPGWFGGDGLIMQKCLDEPNWEGINLYAERSRRLLEMIREDRETVLKG